MKMVTNVCDGGGTVEVDPERLAIRIPEGYEKKIDARLVIPITLMLEPEVNYRRLDAAREFARAQPREPQLRRAATARGWASPARARPITT